jgi:ParB/RepB/Spo0J family partition protein
MPQVMMKPLAWWKPDPKQVRKDADAEQDRQLTESIKVHGILQPPGALPDGTGVYGHRRVRCGLAAGLKETLFSILDRPTSESEVRILQLSENIQRQDITDAEVYLAVKELLALNPTWQRLDVAEKINKSASMATRILSVDNLIPAAREAFLAGAFRFSKAYAISKAATDQEQHEMLAAVLSGTSRNEVEHQGRKRRNGPTTSVRLSRVRIAMPTGMVVISGNELSMSEVVELLAEPLKEARKAGEQYDVKTFQSMMRDIAKGVMHE